MARTSNENHIRDSSTSSEESMTSILINPKDVARKAERKQQRGYFNVTFDLSPSKAPLQTRDENRKLHRKSFWSASNTGKRPRQLKKNSPTSVIAVEGQPAVRVKRPFGEQTYTFEIVFSSSLPNVCLTSKELPPLPLQITDEDPASAPILPKLNFSGDPLEVPEVLLSPFKIEQSDLPVASTGRLIPEVITTLASAQAVDTGARKHDQQSTFAAGAIAKSFQREGSGRVPADDTRRMTEIWVSMFDAEDLLRPTASVSTLRATPFNNTFLYAPSIEGVSPAASSDCYDPTWLPTSSRPLKQSSESRPSKLNLEKPLPPFPSSTSPLSPGMETIRSSLNPFEASFLAASDGLVAVPSPQRRASSPAALDVFPTLSKLSLSDNEKVDHRPLPLNLLSGLAVPGESAQTAVQVGVMGSHRNVISTQVQTPAFKYHSRFRKQRGFRGMSLSY